VIFSEASQTVPVGDSNRDGVFNSSDLVTVFSAGEYEDADDGNSNWLEGDWNHDGDFNTTDLVFAFQQGNYVAEARDVRFTQSSAPSSALRAPSPPRVRGGEGTCRSQGRQTVAEVARLWPLPKSGDFGYKRVPSPPAYSRGEKVPEGRMRGATAR
jgi:hypothetical protein